MKFVFDPAFRKWAYPVALAAVALIGGWGFIATEDLERWNTLFASLFGIAGLSVAKANYTPPADHSDPVDDSIDDDPDFTGE